MEIEFRASCSVWRVLNVWNHTNDGLGQPVQEQGRWNALFSGLTRSRVTAVASCLERVVPGSFALLCYCKVTSLSCPMDTF